MNYRHAFHAGNFADCTKHALLLWILDALGRKPKPFFVLDTHAGLGRYDLHQGDAARTGEWRDGIAKLLNDPPPPLHRYVEAVSAVGNTGEFLYPGSPLLIYHALRDADRLAACELHPEDTAALRDLFRGDAQAGVHLRDGYEAIRALLPPPERRGLVLIDPPYEIPGEFDRVVRALVDGATRFDHGIYVAWYPIKGRAGVTAFHDSIRHTGLRDIVAAELWLRRPIDPATLNGCGLLVRNPPHGFEAAAHDILAALADRLGGPDAGWAVTRIAGE